MFQKRTYEFIPLSFWYDAPLISRDGDRRHDPWLVYGSPTTVRPMAFLDFTSLTLDEFQQLVPPFEAAFHARMAAWRIDRETADCAPVYCL